MDEKDVRRPTSGSQEVPEEEETGEMNPTVDDGNNEETDGEQASSSHHVPDIPVIQAPSAPVTILSLPEEVMELVFKKFSIADLNSCNAVCKTFKTWQDSNIIWLKKLVEKGHDAEAIDYIQNTRLQLVGEDFNTHPLYQAPCLWKYTYIKMNMLKYNWENNVTKKLILHIGFSFNLVDVPEIKINGDLLLIPNYVKNECYVYNTLNIPFFKVKLPCYLRNERMRVHIHKNLIIIVELLILSVFKIDKNGETDLLYRRLLIKKENEIIVPDDPFVDDWYEEFREAIGLIDVCFSNNYLVCCVRRQEKITFYAWELTQGIQVHVQDGSQLRRGVNPKINELSIIELIPPAATHSDEILVRISYICTHTYNVYNFLKPDYRRVLILTLDTAEVIFECSRLVIKPVLVRQNLLQVFDCSINARPNTLIDERRLPMLDKYSDVKAKGDLIAYMYCGSLLVAKYDLLFLPIYREILKSQGKIHFMFSNWDNILVVYPHIEYKNLNTVIHLHDYRKDMVTDISQTELVGGCLIPINSPTKFFLFKYEPDEFVRKITMIQFW